MQLPEPVIFWKFFDFISLLFIIVMVLVLISFHYRKNKNLHKTISETLATNRVSSIIFSIVMTIFFPLYYAFLWFWVGYLINAPTIYFLVLIFSSICEAIFVWVPAKGVGLSRRIHTVTTALVALAMIALPVILIVTLSILNNVDQIAIYSFLGVTILLVIILPTQFFKKYTIYFEAIFCLLFLTMMSIIAHS